MLFPIFSASRIYSLPTSDTFMANTEVVYLQNYGYPDKLVAGNHITICTVNSTGCSISVYTTDIRFSKENDSCTQNLAVQDKFERKHWDCDYKGGFNISKLTFAVPTYITLHSNTSEDLGHVWFAVEG